MVIIPSSFQKLATLLSRGLGPSSNDIATETLLTPSEKIDSVIILDRRVDMITPLLTQLTYEGLIDELIGIKNCSSQFPYLTPIDC
jgi:vacuolar protein sorting-associated protein 33A